MKQTTFSSNFSRLLSRRGAAVIISLVSATSVAHGQATQCNDGVDNDGDGRTDALVIGSTTATTPTATIASGDPHAITLRVVNAGYALRWDVGSMNFDQPTAQKVCEILGYNAVVSFDSRHNDGRNGYTSPSDNLLFKWNPATNVFDSLNAAAAGNRWLATLVCGGIRPACMNARDDDGDGRIDMADTGCSSPTDTSELVHDPGCSSPTDTTEAEQCRDGIDNDGDGARDFPGDFSCANADDDDETNTRSQCQDGVDNDSDGLVDGADMGCSSSQDNNEGDGTSQCQDGIDNDRDGSTDFPADFSCSARTDNDETNPKAACQDGNDNDLDGLTDSADPGCATPQDNNEGDRTSQCQDGIDNDGDGATDFPADFSCSAKTDNDETNPKSGCQDDLDNDADGLTDLLDPGCANKQDNDEGDKTSECQDGIDNDRDGAIDFPADFSCSSKTDDDETNPKSGCQDGVDNDSDGLTDLADPGCSTSQDNNEGDGTSACQDRLDNDKDGLTDMADPGCSAPTDNNEGDGTSACQDKIDNDGDGLIDLADPGCSNAQDGNETDEVSKLQITTECVSNNNDGSYTAYFGYENNLGVEANIISDATKGTLNTFIPALANGGQPTVFKIGRNRGVVSVVFNGDPLVWTVQIAAGVKSSATASSSSIACAPVQPVAECIDSNSSGLLGTFGFINSNPFPVTIPVGVNNTFTVSPAGRGQPTTLQAGTNKGVFVVPFKDQATWKLGSTTATITSTSPVCQGGCVGTSTADITSSLDDAAIKLAELAKKSADYLNAQAKKQLSTSAAKKVSSDVVRSKRKAEALYKEARSLTLGFPAVIRSCPNAAQVCKSVDNGAVIDRLKGLYQQLFKMSARAVARGDFRVAGSTANTRGNALVLGAKAAQQAGLTALTNLPRTSTQCS